MAKNDNLIDFLTDIANAIRETKGTSDLINAQDFADEIKSVGGNSGDNSTTPSRPNWTGHADVEGLKAIGWTDEDIAYYQENGVNWNEEDDQHHLVSDDNKALYGVLTADNISSYKDRIVYLPKIDTSTKTSMYQMFYNCYSLVSIPELNTSNVKSMSNMFYNCYSLTCIPQLDTSNVTNMSDMFTACCSLVSIPQLDTSKVNNMQNMFYECSALVSIPQLNTSNVTSMYYMFCRCYSLVSIPQLDTSNVTNMGSMFYDCFSLISIHFLDTSKVYSMKHTFYRCYSLVAIPKINITNIINPNEDYNIFFSCYSLSVANLENIKISIDISNSHLLSKNSLLYIINNEATTEAITIKMHSYAYRKLANDADVVAALAAHPNISLAQ